MKCNANMYVWLGLTEIFRKKLTHPNKNILCILFLGRTERCACVKDFGVSLYNPGSKANNGDLDNPHIKPYEQCPDSKASSCQVNKGS